jgi:hypothetical protein
MDNCGLTLLAFLSEVSIFMFEFGCALLLKFKKMLLYLYLVIANAKANAQGLSFVTRRSLLVLLDSIYLRKYKT